MTPILIAFGFVCILVCMFAHLEGYGPVAKRYYIKDSNKWMVVKHPYIDYYTIVNIDRPYQGEWFNSRSELDIWLAKNDYYPEA